MSLRLITSLSFSAGQGSASGGTSDLGGRGGSVCAAAEETGASVTGESPENRASPVEEDRVVGRGAVSLIRHIPPPLRPPSQED